LFKRSLSRYPSASYVGSLTARLNVTKVRFGTCVAMENRESTVLLGPFVMPCFLSCKNCESLVDHHSVLLMVGFDE